MKIDNAVLSSIKVTEAAAETERQVAADEQAFHVVKETKKRRCKGCGGFDEYVIYGPDHKAMAALCDPIAAANFCFLVMMGVNLGFMVAKKQFAIAEGSHAIQ